MHPETSSQFSAGNLIKCNTHLVPRGRQTSNCVRYFKIFQDLVFFPSFSLLQRSLAQLKSLFLVLTYFIHSLISMTESSSTCSMSFVLKCFLCVGVHVSYWPASLVRCSSLEACFRREINLLSGMASLTCSRSSTRAATPTVTSPTLTAFSR